MTYSESLFVFLSVLALYGMQRRWNPLGIAAVVGLATVVLVVIGARRRWLNARELLLSAGLLLMAYGLQASRACMSSHARYASVVFPVYIVLGQLLHRAPAPLAAALLAISGLMLGIYSAMFVSWYWFY
jgi:hypothetical protein